MMILKTGSAAITHFMDVIDRSDIGFRADDTTIGMKVHSNHVRDHHPWASIYYGHKMVQYQVRFNACQGALITEDHHMFDMMIVSCFVGLGKEPVHMRHFGLAGPEKPAVRRPPASSSYP